jgi:hypothetical protein
MTIRTVVVRGWTTYVEYAFRLSTPLARLTLVGTLAACTASASASTTPPPPSSGGCATDSSVTGCVSGSVGYSCPSGSSPPDQSDPTLVCSVPTSTNGSDDYCCYTNTITPPSGATCAQDPSVAGCQPDSAGNPSYGFSCTGSDTPDMDFSNITCSMGTSGMDSGGNAATLFCCTYQ